MAVVKGSGRRSRGTPTGAPRVKSALPQLVVAVAFTVGFAAFAGGQSQQVPEAPRMTGRYHFLGPEDTISILQEEDGLKGYIDVFPGSGESDSLLSYQLVIGSRKGNHVEFKTRTIHEKYFRFFGTVERGAGAKPSRPDYLQLQGDLETVTLNSVTGEQKVEKQAVVFKSIPRGEGPPD